jgi:hypothetical protein
MSEEQWQPGIGRRLEDGRPVIYKLSEFPSKETRGQHSWLSIVSWPYDGSQRNGMPTVEVNERMLVLEHALNDREDQGHCRHAYSRTGNNLKELALYVSSREQFMGAFNRALVDEPRFPIQITFYEDPEWTDFRAIMQVFYEGNRENSESPSPRTD